MDRPFLLQLQCLLGRMGEGVPLCPNDIDIVDHAFAAPQTSELANSLNEIYTLLAKAPLRNFCDSFAALIAHARHNSTRLLAHAVLNRRIRAEWPAFDENARASLREFLVNGIDRSIEDKDHALLMQLNQGLVSVFRYEWDSLFKDFVGSMEETGLIAGPEKVLNNLTLLKLVLSEGFDMGQVAASSTEQAQFRQSIEQDMRGILKYICLCLHNEGEREERMARISRCLETLLHSVEYIPAFELFNCNLIQLLVGLIGVPDHKAILTSCFEEIFRFREAGTTGNSHAKIVKKLLLILECYLERFERTLNGDLPQQKETVSTEDSFQSRKTRRRNVVNSQTHSDLMYLLYEFLVRYVPFMHKARGEGDLDIEYEGNTKLYFSQDLYDAFGMIFWRLVAFLHSTLDRFDPFKLGEATEEKLEEGRKVVVCLKLLIAMQAKLKLETREEVGELIEMAVLNFTTLPAEFQPYYLQFKMLQNGGEVATRLPPFSAELEEVYKDLIRQVLSHRAASKLYFGMLVRRAEEVIADYAKQRISQAEQPLQQINTLNRVCWSAVYAYAVDPQLTRKYGFDKILGDLVKKGQMQLRPIELAKCFLANSKYLSQIYHNHRTIEVGLIPALEKSGSETVVEYALTLLSKILMDDKLQAEFQLEDVHLIIDKLQFLEKLNPMYDTLLALYPALVRLLTLMFDPTSSKSRSRFMEILEKLVGDELETLSDFSMSNHTMDQEELQRTILHFRKLTEIGEYLQLPSKKPASQAVFVGWTRTALFDAIQKFQFKNACFRDYLIRVQREDFDILHILKFRKYYHEALREHAALTTLVALSEKDTRPRSKENEKMVNIVTAEAVMRADFVAQRHFKCRQFMDFALEVYRLLVASKAKQHVEVINQSVSEVMESLEGWEEDPEVTAGKYVFWKELAKHHLLRLSKKNREHFVHLLQEFESTTTQAAHLELILDVFETAVDALSRECLGEGKPLLPEFVEVFLGTFERLFSWRCKREAMFDRVGGLLLMLVDLAGSLRVPLQPQSKKDNIDILYLLLQRHIERQIGVEFDQQHCFRLQRLFQQRQAARWRTELRDYTVYLMRIHESRQRAH